MKSEGNPNMESLMVWHDAQLKLQQEQVWVCHSTLHLHQCFTFEEGDPDDKSTDVGDAPAVEMQRVTIKDTDLAQVIMLHYVHNQWWFYRIPEKMA